MDDDDPYETLGVSRAADAAAIRCAYRALATTRHPDAGGSTSGWVPIQRAYDTLIDEDARAALDAWLDGDGEGWEESGGEADEDGGAWSDADSDAAAAADGEAAWQRPLSPFDLAAAIGVPPPDKDGALTGGDTRVRARFYLLSSRTRPLPYERYDDPADHASAVAAYRRVCLAFAVLKDEERRRIYAGSGFGALRASESFQEESLFDLDARMIAARFFAATDDADRDFLLRNATDAFDDEAYDERCARRAAAERAGGEDGALGGDAIGEAAPGLDADVDGEEGDDDELCIGAEGATSNPGKLTSHTAALLAQPPPPPPLLLGPAPIVQQRPLASQSTDLPVEIEWERMHATLTNTIARRHWATMPGALREQRRKRWRRHFWWRTLTSHRPRLRANKILSRRWRAMPRN
jgi:curved DNA-binding protein CbpA